MGQLYDALARVVLVALPPGLEGKVPAALGGASAVVRVGTPQELRVGPLVGSVEVAVNVRLEECVVDAIVLGEVDVLGIRVVVV